MPYFAICAIKAYMLKILFFSLVFLMPLRAETSGTITGAILEPDGKTPIQGADVYLIQIERGTISQIDGRFTIEDLPFTELSLKVSMIGFKDVNKLFELDKPNYDLGKILMVRDTLIADQIIVDSHLELQPKTSASSIYITGEEYQKNLKSSLALTIEEETGLAVRSMGQGVTQPILRGYSGDRFLLTENGVTTGDMSHTSIDHTVSVDMASFNKIRIIRGPEALLYGSNTIGGVIDISRQVNESSKFKKPRVQSVFGTESSNSGLFGNIVYYLPIGYKNQFRFSLLERNAKNQMTPNGALKNTALSNRELVGSYSYFGQKFRSTISFEKINMAYGIPGSPEGHIDGVDIDLNKNTQKFHFHKEISLMGFQTLDIDQRFINYEHTESEKGSYKPSVILEQRLFSLQNILRGQGLHIGSQFQHRYFQPAGFYWTPHTKELNIAAFGLIEKKIDRYFFQISSRIEYQSVIPELFHGVSNIEISEVVERNFSLISAGLTVYRNWDYWELSFGTMLTGRAPGIEDLFSDGPHLGVYAYEIGEPLLNKEKTTGFELSLKGRSDKSEVRITGYQNFSPNYHLSRPLGNCDEEFILGESHPCAGAEFIEWGAGSSGWLYKYKLSGIRTAIYGFESELKYKLFGSINLFGKISMIRGENLSDGTPLEYIPPDKYFLSTELDLNPISVLLILKKVSAQNRLGEFETKTNGYFIANMSLTYSLNRTSLKHKVILGLDNIFNQEYYNHLSSVKEIMPEKGRSLRILYRIFF